MADMREFNEDAWASTLEAHGAFWETQPWTDRPREAWVEAWERHLEALDLSVESFAGQDVLDIGCGMTGVIWFVQGGRRVGLDPTASRFWKWAEHWSQDVELVDALGEDIPFPSDSFDTVFCINVLDHTYKPAAILSELKRVLRPGGMVVLHMDLDSPLRSLHKLLRKECRRLHPHHLSYAWLMNELADFSIEATHRDPEVFEPRWENLKNEKYWDGLVYKLTGSDRFINHLWVKAKKPS